MFETVCCAAKKKGENPSKPKFGGQKKSQFQVFKKKPIFPLLVYFFRVDSDFTGVDKGPS